MMVAVGVLIALHVFRSEAAARGLPGAVADAAVAGVLGGFLGAKLLYVAEHAGEEPVREMLFARGGLSWFGGFAGGVGAGLSFVARKRWPVLPVLAVATPALAIGHAIGRLGCFLVGDDYGRPADLPWGIAFPEGLPPTTDRVHPTQLYEAIPLVLFTFVLIRWRRQGIPDAVIVARYLIVAGIVRFLIEFIRVNPRVAVGLTVAQWASGLAVLGGILLLLLHHWSTSKPTSAPA